MELMLQDGGKEAIVDEDGSDNGDEDEYFSGDDADEGGGEEGASDAAAEADLEASLRGLVQPVYAGAPEAANLLSVIVNLLTWKTSNVIKDKAFDHLLRIVSAVLPPNHALPRSYAACKRAIGKPLFFFKQPGMQDLSPCTLESDYLSLLRAQV